jgi:pSer/pThr/pTyr-binding forkhead associated (FHA) protein
VTFTAAMRVGSLEILGALAACAFISARLRVPSTLRASAVTVRLNVQEGTAGDVRELTLTLTEGKPASIGRSSEADIPLSDPEVSRRHARLDLVRGVIYVADLGSSNGTFLNGKPLSDGGIEVRPGDDVDVGNTRITITETTPTP